MEGHVYANRSTLSHLADGRYRLSRTGAAAVRCMKNCRYFSCAPVPACVTADTVSVQEGAHSALSELSVLFMVRLVSL